MSLSWPDTRDNNDTSDISRHPDNEMIPGLLLLRVESSLFYFNIENIRSIVWTEILRSDRFIEMRYMGPWYITLR